MDTAQTAILNSIVDDIDETYKKFLVAKGLFGSSVVKAGIYSALEEIVVNDPYPDGEIQAAVLAHVYARRIEAEDVYLEELEFMLVEVTQSRQSV